MSKVDLNPNSSQSKKQPVPRFIFSSQSKPHHNLSRILAPHEQTLTSTIKKTKATHTSKGDGITQKQRPKNSSKKHTEQPEIHSFNHNRTVTHTNTHVHYNLNHNRTVTHNNTHGSNTQPTRQHTQSSRKHTGQRRTKSETEIKRKGGKFSNFNL